MAVLPSFAEKKQKEHSPYKYEVNVSWGYMPFIASNYDHYRYGSANSLANIYGNYTGKSVTTGLISADFNIHFKWWFALGTQLNTAVIKNAEMSAITGEKVDSFHDYTISALVYARFTYLNRKYVKLYSSVGAGLGYTYSGAPEKGSDSPMDLTFPRGQLVPIGITAGDRVYGMAELGFGTEYTGFRVGIGYRF